MFDGLLSDVKNEFETLPEEIGIEGVAQIKNSNQTKTPQDQSQTGSGGDSNSQDHKNYLQDLYGTSSLTPQQIELKKQQENIIKKRYQDIQTSIQEYRAKKAQMIREDEAGKAGLENKARTQEEKMELWEEQRKKSQEEREKVEAIVMPGSVQSRSGEQGQIMG